MRLSKSMSRCSTLLSSYGISPVSIRVLKIGAYFFEAEITFIMFSRVGIVGIFLSYL